MHACTCHHQTFQISILFYHIDQNLFKIRIWNGRKKILTKDSRRKKKCSFRKKKKHLLNIFETPGIRLCIEACTIWCIFGPQKANSILVLLYIVYERKATNLLYTHIGFFLHNHYHSTELTATTATIWEKHMQRRHTLPTSMHRKKNLNPIAK